MNRVENAISQGRCVLAVGGRALQSPEVQAELRRRTLSPIALGGEVINPAVALSADALAPALDREGGVLVLIEPEGAVDGRALGELEKLIAGSKHKPRLVVAAKAFNPFGLPMALRTLKFEQEKARAVDFIASLPVDAPAPTIVIQAPAPAGKGGRRGEPKVVEGKLLDGKLLDGKRVVLGQAAEAPKGEGKLSKDEQRKAEAARAPRPVLIGREDELAAFAALLAAPGSPLIVSGPQGAGRRWLVESALAAAGKKRLPDFVFGHGAGVDALLARFAVLTKELAGDDRLSAAITAAERPAPAELAALVVEALSAPALADFVMVLSPLDALLDRRDGSFYRNGRLEMVLKALLLAAPALQLVFITDLAPTFYREGEATHQRLLALDGVRGKELHALFEAWHAPEFARSHFGPISERTHGHPLASRAFALAVRSTPEGVEKVLESPKLLKAAALNDLEPLRRNLKRAVEKLDDEARTALLAAALPRIPVDAADLQVLGLGRTQRLDLLSRGLLEQTPGEGDRQFYVHSLVREQLPRIDVEDFDRMEALALHWQAKAKELKGKGEVLNSLRFAQESNRLFVLARRARGRLRLPFPDADAMVDELRGMVRRKREPRHDIARQRLNEVLGSERGNTELLLLEAELRVAENAPAEAIIEAFGAAAALPTPEVFHTEATWHLDRGSRAKAAGALHRGIALFPADARLRRRLAGVEMGLGRLAEAVETLKAAQALEPMMPDTYGMLGEAYARLGEEHWEAADQNIEEALRLAPESAQHLARRAELLRLRALVRPDEREDLLSRAEALLRQALTIEAGHGRIQVLLAGVLLDRDGDLEQIAWLLKEAVRPASGGKRKESPESAIQRARLLGRKRQFEEAERLIAKVIKSDHHNHAALAAHAELLAAQGSVAGAHAAWALALERAPAYAPERALYERERAALQLMLDAGITQIDPPEGVAAPVTRAEPAARRSTVRRRRGGGAAPAADPSAEASAEDSADGATSEDAAESAEPADPADDEPELDGGFDGSSEDTSDPVTEA
ncbi:MAG: tetratricopeptide repeat protein [Deltaproteobacteria bacterium]|nr:tetratricopeptide repeat protein [Deltaproteobacteria bacterium]